MAGCLDSYEQMRGQALKGECPHSGCGTAILVRSGMATWMRAWAAFSLRTPEQRHVLTSADDSLPIRPMVSEYYGQLAAILASMFLATRQEVVA
jgi:hypothetical protein